MNDTEMAFHMLKSMEVGIQTLYFISLRASMVVSRGTVDRARAIIDTYLNQYSWNGARLVRLGI